MPVDDTEKAQKKDLPKGAVVGIIIASFFAAAILFGILTALVNGWMKKRRGTIICAKQMHDCDQHRRSCRRLEEHKERRNLL